MGGKSKIAAGLALCLFSKDAAGRIIFSDRGDQQSENGKNVKEIDDCCKRDVGDEYDHSG
jgi:hypothetical protein